MRAFNDMEHDIREIQERNRRVELEKAWETSLTRRGIIAIITYVVAYLWLVNIGNEKALQNALVPFLGYLFSTWSIPVVKKWWIQKQ